MHIPDGYLSPSTCAALGAAMVPAWGVSSARLKRLGAREVPLLALGSAFSFVVMMFNVPTPWGTGHAVGSGITAILLGPSAAVVTTTVALALQYLLAGDGGLLTLGANAFNMALLMPVAAFAVFRLLASGTPSPRRRALAAAAGGYVGLNIAAFATALETGLQPVLFRAADGTPEYAPYGLSVSLPALVIPHLLIFGVVEAIATAGVVAWAAERTGHASPEPRGTGTDGRSFAAGWAVLGARCLLSPLGALAAGDAWGEWAPDELKARLGYTPPGLARLADLWKGVLPDYNWKGGPEAGPSRLLAYALSATLGVLLVGGAVWLLGRIVVPTSALQPTPAPEGAPPPAAPPAPGTPA